MLRVRGIWQSFIERVYVEYLQYMAEFHRESVC